MDYLDKVLSSVNNNVEEALKEIDGLETAIDFNEPML